MIKYNMFHFVTNIGPLLNQKYETKFRISKHLILTWLFSMGWTCFHVYLILTAIGYLVWDGDIHIFMSS